jgi:type II secretory pathway pseudopilin PulG
MDAERGFTLLEALVATTLAATVVVGLAGVVAASTHAAATAQLRIGLEDDAASVLADVRAITAYDDTMLQRIVGRSATMTRTLRGGARETIELSVTLRPLATAAPVNANGATANGATQIVARATVTVDDVRVTEDETLFHEAPAPGSTVEQQ